MSGLGLGLGMGLRLGSGVSEEAGPPDPNVDWRIRMPNSHSGSAIQADELWMYEENPPVTDVFHGGFVNLTGTTGSGIDRLYNNSTFSAWSSGLPAIVEIQFSVPRVIESFIFRWEANTNRILDVYVEYFLNAEWRTYWSLLGESVGNTGGTQNITYANPG